MNERKLTVKRIVIFCVLSFIPLAAMALWLYLRYRRPVFADGDTSAVAYIVGLGMMFPAAASLITRAVTKEGMKDSYLWLGLDKSPMTYLFSVLYKLLEAVCAMIVLLLILSADIPFSEKIDLGEGCIGIALILMNLAASVITFFPAFGEELGWRGYLMPKLLELTSKPKAIVTGGVIWGLWHAPVTVLGHNFGVGYWGFPFTGMLVMCLYCTLLNALLTYVTERTKSVYPAAFLHAINNNLSAGVLITALSSERFNESLSAYPEVKLRLIMWGTVLFFAALSGGICFYKFVKEGEKS